MSLSTWRAVAAPAAKQILQDFEPTELGARRALFAMAALLATTNSDFHGAYTMLQESSLQRQRDDWMPQLSAGRPALRDPLTDQDMVLVLGGLVRALDSILLEFASFLGPTQPEDLTDLTVDGYIIRRKRPRPLARLKPNQGFWRRGLVHHRIIPRTVGGLPVSIHFAETMAARSGELPTSGVAAAFPGLKLSTAVTSQREGVDCFRAIDVIFTDSENALANHLIKVSEPGVFTAVWPELTIPPAMLSVIQDGLGRQRIRSDHNDLQVLVAGSWHVERGGKWWNSAPILDGYGKVLATYEKLTPFYSAGIGYEDVTLGAGIPVIVTDDYVVAIAICKDFCDLSRVADLAQLDVDLFLVPSMGGDSTMSGHQTMAKHLTVQRGSRAFVVQQPENGSAALVLGMVGDPLSPGAVAVQTESADTYQGNFGN